MSGTNENGTVQGDRPPTQLHTPPIEAEPLWQLDRITKTYPGVRANDAVSMTLYPGEIHGLLGENGSGKSTLIKILSGVHQPDSGTIYYQGQPVRLDNPTVARQRGVATVFQEFSLVATLSVAENIFLGRYPRRAGGVLIDWQTMRKESARILSELDIQIDPERPVGQLSVAEQQLVEIAKAIYLDAKMLILDEPTTALGEHEIKVLHGLLRRMKNRGVAILYISHRLDEVIELVDTFTVLKDGCVASTSEESQLDVDYIVERMVGHGVEQHYPKDDNCTTEVMFEVRAVNSNSGVRNCSFQVKRGEVLGLGGVIGSGRTEIARALFGVDKLTSGEIYVEGSRVKIHSPTDAIRQGIALLTENRKSDGLFFNFVGAPNISSASLGKLTHFGILDKGKESTIGEQYVDDLEMSAGASQRMVKFLSGGNQQKVVIARWLFANAKVLILDEPTQGIDIAAKVAVYKLINKLTSEGRSVILISSDYKELMAMSDRIAIVREGTIVEIKPTAEVTQSDMMRASAVSSATTEV